MRLSLWNQPEIGKLSQALLQSLKQLMEAIKVGWTQQHDGDGAHTDVTADSVTVTNVGQLGAIRIGNIVQYTQLGVIPTGRLDDLSVPGLATASVLKITISAAAISLTGIDATGRKPGDLLLLINNDQVVAGAIDFSIAAGSTNSALANRFIGSAASTAPWTLQGSQGVLLMYDSYTNAGLTTLYGWRVISGVA